jgi:hypothetical protein
VWTSRRSSTRSRATSRPRTCSAPRRPSYADLARWEIQRRQREGRIGNLGARNLDERASLKYKRAFFVDWRAADRLKRPLLSSLDFLLDTNDPAQPKLIAEEWDRRSFTQRPQRVGASASAIARPTARPLLTSPGRETAAAPLGGITLAPFGVFIGAAQ